MPIDHKIINASSKLNEYRSNSINGRVSYATKQYLVEVPREYLSKFKIYTW